MQKPKIPSKTHLRIFPPNVIFFQKKQRPHPESKKRYIWIDVSEIGETTPKSSLAGGF